MGLQYVWSSRGHKESVTILRGLRPRAERVWSFKWHDGEGLNHFYRDNIRQPFLAGSSAVTGVSFGFVVLDSTMADDSMNRLQ